MSVVVRLQVEDHALFGRLRALSKEGLLKELPNLKNERGVYRTMESEHIAFLLDSLDGLLEESIRLLRTVELAMSKGSDNESAVLWQATKDQGEKVISDVLQLELKLIKKD